MNLKHAWLATASAFLLAGSLDAAVYITAPDDYLVDKAPVIVRAVALKIAMSANVVLPAR